MLGVCDAVVKRLIQLKCELYTVGEDTLTRGHWISNSVGSFYSISVLFAFAFPFLFSFTPLLLSASFTFSVRLSFNVFFFLFSICLPVTLTVETSFVHFTWTFLAFYMFSSLIFLIYFFFCLVGWVVVWFESTDDRHQRLATKNHLPFFIRVFVLASIFWWQADDLHVSSSTW